MSIKQLLFRHEARADLLRRAMALAEPVHLIRGPRSTSALIAGLFAGKTGA